MQNRQVRVRSGSSTRSVSSWERVLVGLLGGILGILFSCCLAVAVLSLLDTDPRATPATAPPAEYGIEAIVEERYIDRAFAAGTTGYSMPEFLVPGHLDVRPDGLIDFVVQLRLGPLRPSLPGTVALHVSAAGELKVTLTELKVGRLSLAPLVPDGLLASVNEDVNQLVSERTTATGVRLLGIDSDETTLRLYLVSGR